MIWHQLHKGLEMIDTILNNELDGKLSLVGLFNNQYITDDSIILRPLMPYHISGQRLGLHTFRHRNESGGRPETSNHIYLSFNWSLDFGPLRISIP